MSISSCFVNQDAFPDRYVVLNTERAGRQVLVSLGVGAIEGKNTFLTNVARSALARLNVIHGNVAGKIHFVEVASQTMAKSRVPFYLGTAEEGDSIFFVCKNSQVYDRVYRILGVDHG